MIEDLVVLVKAEDVVLDVKGMVEDVICVDIVWLA